MLLRAIIIALLATCNCARAQAPLGTLDGGVAGKPGFVLPGAQVDLLFATNFGWQAGYGQGPAANFITTVRASTRWQPDLSGLLHSFPSGVAAITNVGLGVWQATTNEALYSRDLTQAAWTAPGHSALEWMRSRGPGETLLCECEMVASSAVDAIYSALRLAGDSPTLTDIGLRSRVGKGACQGSLCSVRTAVHLYHKGEFQAQRGLAEMVDFLNERWRGQHAVLWGEQLAQAELTEAIHCGLFGEELGQAGTLADVVREVAP